MSGTDVMIRGNGTQLDTMTLGRMLAQSGYFKDSRDVAQAVVRVLAGAEMGFGPVASMVGVHIIEGKPTISAGLMASAVKRSGKYDYRVTWWNPKEGPIGCSISFYQGKEELGESSFSVKDAEAAGLAGKGPWKQYPRNMCFARAMSNGVRWYCPDVFQATVYTPEELGADVNDEGEAINLPATVVTVLDPPAEEHKAADAQEYDAEGNRITHTYREEWDQLTKIADGLEIKYANPPENASDAVLQRYGERLETLIRTAQASRT